MDDLLCDLVVAWRKRTTLKVRRRRRDGQTHVRAIVMIPKRDNSCCDDGDDGDDNHTNWQHRLSKAHRVNHFSTRPGDVWFFTEKTLTGLARLYFEFFVFLIFLFFALFDTWSVESSTLTRTIIRNGDRLLLYFIRTAARCPVISDDGCTATCRITENATYSQKTSYTRKNGF